MTLPEDDYPLFRRRVREAEERIAEAQALIRDMLPNLRAPGYEHPGHRRAQREIQGLRRRAGDFNRKASAA